MMDAALLEKIGFQGTELKSTTVADLIDEGVLDRPLDGNHGEIHPKASDYVEEGIPFVMATDLKNGRVDLDGCYKIPENIANGLRKGFAKTGDVLLSHKATLGRVAKVGEIKHDFIVLTPQTTYYRILKPTVLHPDYLVQYFRSQYFQDIFSLWGGSGSTRAYLGITAQKKLPIVFPPIAAQQKIAAILTAYDDLIENNRQRIALLEKMAEEIYREWFVRLRFPGHEHTPVHKGVPEGWELKHLPECITVKPQESIDVQDSRPFVGMDRLSTTSAFFTTDEQRTGASGPRFRNGDTLLPRITPCLENGKRGFVMCLEDDEVASGSTEFIVLRGKTLPPEFVYCLSVSDGFRKHCENSMVGASGRQRVHEGCLNWVLIKHPPAQIAEKFSEVTSPMYQQAKRLLDQNAKLEQTRDLLLNRLISGKLRVDDLDIRFPPSMQEEAA